MFNIVSLYHLYHQTSEGNETENFFGKNGEVFPSGKIFVLQKT